MHLDIKMDPKTKLTMVADSSHLTSSQQEVEFKESKLISCWKTKAICTNF